MEKDGLDQLFDKESQAKALANSTEGKKVALPLGLFLDCLHHCESLKLFLFDLCSASNCFQLTHHQIFSFLRSEWSVASILQLITKE